MERQQGLGRVEHFDARNLNYLISDVATPKPDDVKRALLSIRSGKLPEASAPQPGRKYYWDAGWWGDQGQTSSCTAFALAHSMADGPVTHPGQNPIMDPMELYRAIQAEDIRNGRNYGFDGGATSLAMAETAKRLGWIGEYRWGYSLADWIAAIQAGPVLLGIDWPVGMDTPDAEGIVRFTGRVRGGHEIVSNGADFVRGLCRLKQSWGRENYGRNGHAYLPFEDLEKAIAQYGDVLMFREMKTDDPRTKRDESIVR
jgi:hypothetical protein